MKFYNSHLRRIIFNLYMRRFFFGLVYLHFIINSLYIESIYNLGDKTILYLIFKRINGFVGVQNGKAEQPV